jgi:galactose mutarotase-like enzyme
VSESEYSALEHFEEHAEDLIESHRRHRQSLIWKLGPVNTIVPQRQTVHHHHHRYPRKGSISVSFTLKDNQEATFQLVGTDAGGNDTPFTGTPKFSVDDPSILTLVDNGDGKGTVSAAGKVGTGTLSVTDAETDGSELHRFRSYRCRRRSGDCYLDQPRYPYRQASSDASSVSNPFSSIY